MRRVAVPPPLLAGAALAVQFRVSDSKPTAASATIGALVAAASITLALTAVSEFGRRGTTVNPIDLHHVDALVTSGPSRLTRNPMYVGLAGVLLGHSIAQRSIRALVPMAVYVALIDRFQIPAEEAALRERFGADFDAYAERVPRWIGWLE